MVSTVPLAPVTHTAESAPAAASPTHHPRELCDQHTHHVAPPSDLKRCIWETCSPASCRPWARPTHPQVSARDAGDAGEVAAVALGPHCAAATATKSELPSGKPRAPDPARRHCSGCCRCGRCRRTAIAPPSRPGPPRRRCSAPRPPRRDRVAHSECENPVDSHAALKVPHEIPRTARRSPHPVPGRCRSSTQVK